MEEVTVTGRLDEDIAEFPSPNSPFDSSPQHFIEISTIAQTCLCPTEIEVTKSEGSSLRSPTSFPLMFGDALPNITVPSTPLPQQRTSSAAPPNEQVIS